MRRWAAVLCALLAAAGTAGRAGAGPVYEWMYDDEEQGVGGWFSHQEAIPDVTAPVHGGTRAKMLRFADGAHAGDGWAPSFSYTYSWQGAMDTTPFDRLVFYVNGGARGGQRFRLTSASFVPGIRPLGKDVYVNDLASIDLPDRRYLAGGLKAFPANRWVRVSIPLSDLKVAASDRFHGLAFRNLGEGRQEPVYLDDMRLEGFLPGKAAIQVDATAPIRKVSRRMFGINTYGVADYRDPAQIAAGKEAGYGLQRVFYPTFGLLKSGRVATGPLFAQAVGSDMIACVNFADVGEDDVKPLPGDKRTYGTAEEAAAIVAYTNCPLDAAEVTIGKDVYGRDWGTNRRWARLRAAARLAQDDGWNQLRIAHPAPFDIRYWELDNEPWLRGGDNGGPTDWLRLANWTKAADALMRKMSPRVPILTGISLIIGGDAGSPAHTVTVPGSDSQSQAYDDVLLYYLAGHDPAASPGRYVPDFIVDHNYIGAKFGKSSDEKSLLNLERPYASWTSTSWDIQARHYRSELKTFYGATDGAKPHFIVTECNLASGFPLFKQLHSIVSALFLGDALGQLMQSAPGEFEGLTWHDWDDGDLNKGGIAENSAQEGWRNEFSYNVYGAASKEGVRTKYPTHYAFRLMSRFFAHDGDAVVRARTIGAASSSVYLQPYAVAAPGGGVRVLVINKSRDTDVAATIAIKGYTPRGRVRVYRYGREEERNEADISRSTAPAGQLILFPAFSMTVVELGAESGVPQPPAPAARAPGRVTGLTAQAYEAEVKLSWQPAAGATDYTVRRSESPAGPWVTLTTHPYERNNDQSLCFTRYADRHLAVGRTYYYQVVATNRGTPGAPAAAAATPTGLGAWMSMDLNEWDHGSARVDPKTGAFELWGDGSGWYWHDQGRFVYRALVGDGSITARVAAVQKGGLWGKNYAGVEIRASRETTTVATDSDASLGVSFAAVGISGEDVNGAQLNANGDGLAKPVYVQDEVRAHAAPYWVRLTRAGDTLTAFIAPDGRAWTRIGEPLVYRSLPRTVYAGLVTNSEVLWTQTSARFDSVRIEGTTVPVAPLRPRRFAAVGKPDGIHLSWHHVSGALGYKLYRGTESDAQAHEPLATTRSTSFVDASATTGTIYYYKLVATAPTGESVPADEVAAAR